MRVLVVGDMHVTPWGVDSKYVDQRGMSPRAETIMQTAHWVHRLFLEHAADLMVINGDYSHNPNSIDPPTLSLMVAVDQIWNGIPRVYNIGNHDVSRRYSSCNNLALLKLGDGVVPDTEVITHYGLSVFPSVPTVGLDELESVVVLPYWANREAQLAAVQKVSPGSTLFLHYPVLGQKMTPTVSESSPESLTKEDLSHVRTVLSHYHAPSPPSKKTLDVGDILLTGAPYASSFSDTEEAYGVWLLCTETGAVEFLKNPYSPVFKTVQSGYTPKENEVVRVAPETQDVRVSSGTAMDLIGEYFSQVDQGEQYLSEIAKFAKNSLSKLQIRIQSVEVTNFLSWKDGRFEVPSGSTLITGSNHDTLFASSNGSGKSAILEAIVFALYGKTPRGATAGAVTRKGTTSSEVVLNLFVGDKAVKITRGRKNGSPYVKLEVDGEDVSSVTQSDADKATSTLVGLSFDQYRLLAYWHSGFESTKISQMSPTELTTSVETLFGMDYLDEAHDDASKRASVASVALTKAVSDVEKAQNRIDLLRTKRDSITSPGEFVPDQERQAQIAHLEKTISECGPLRYQSPAPLLQEISKLEAQLKQSEEGCSQCGYRKTPDVDPLHLDSLRAELKAVELVSGMTSRLDMLKFQATVEENAYSESKAQYDRIIESFDSDLEQELTQKEELEAKVVQAQLTLEYLQGLVRHLSPSGGVRSLFLQEVLNGWNQVLRESNSLMFDSPTAVQVSTTKTLKSGKEKFMLSVEVQDSTYATSSSGERRKIDFVLALSLVKTFQLFTGASVSPIIMDEVLDTLDPTAAKSVLETCLTILPVDYAIISHNDTYSVGYSNHHHVKKISGVSSWSIG